MMDHEGASILWAIGGAVCLTSALILGIAALLWEWLRPEPRQEI